MVRNALRLLSAEVRGLHAAVYVLAVSALLSSLLALLRDRLLAYQFGASRTLDLYYAAFRIPDLIFVAVGALVSVYILIPELSKRSGESQRDYVDTVVAGFSLTAIVVCAVAALVAPSLLALLFPRIASEGSLPALALLTRIMLIQPVMLGLSNILASITQFRHRYALYSVSPLLYNAGIIVGVVLLYPFFGLAGLAWGVVAGAFFHAAVQVPSIVSDGFLRRWPRFLETRALLKTVAISVPRALSLSMGQLAFMGLTVLAGALSPGSIAVFMFAYNLQAVPLSVIGSSYSVAAFPTLSAALARGERNLFVEHVATAARHLVFWSLPATALVVVLRANIVRVVLGSGRFDWTDTRLTAASLGLFSLSLAAQGLTLLVARAYYAAGRTLPPFVAASATAVLTLVLGAASVSALRHGFLLAPVQELLRVSDVPGSTVLALAFSYALISIFGAAGLLLHFEGQFGGFLKRVAPSWGQSLAASLLGGLAAYAILQLVGPIALSSTLLSVFLRGFEAGAAGAIVIALTYRLLDSREYRETVGAWHAKVRAHFSPAPLEVEIAAPAEETAA